MKAGRARGKILFVVHSMGGLVVKEGLTLARDSSEPHVENVFKATFGIAFLGAPHLGAGLAYWATLGSKFLRPFKRTNKPLLEVLNVGSETLDGIQRRFHDMIAKRGGYECGQKQGLPLPTHLVCFAEELALNVAGRVVEPDSARLDGCPCTTIRVDHMGMTRFTDSDDPGSKKVSGVLWGWEQNLKALAATARTTAPVDDNPPFDHRQALPPTRYTAPPQGQSTGASHSTLTKNRENTTSALSRSALEPMMAGSNQLATRPTSSNGGHANAVTAVYTTS